MVTCEKIGERVFESEHDDLLGWEDIGSNGSQPRAEAFPDGGGLGER